MKKKEECVLYYGFNGGNQLEIEDENGQTFSVAHGITSIQALNLAKIFTNRYDSVKLFDGEEEAYLLMKNRTDTPEVHVYYEESRTDIEKKYGLHVEEEDEDKDQTDLDKEKWDNYWGDFNQCGVRVDSY